MQAPPAIGHVICDRYRIVEQLGTGGMGVVWAAESLDGRVPVAIKVVKNAPDGSVLRRRIVLEAKAAAKIDHPNVVRVLELIELPDGAPAIVMERLYGETLGDRMRREGVCCLSL